MENQSSPHNFPVFHKDENLFKAAIEYSVKDTGFRAELIEKDYFCSLLLNYLFYNNESVIIFKGGTCINKVYTSFYRLSEDLDFTIPISYDASQGQRRRAIQPIKYIFRKIGSVLPEIRISEPLTGHNSSRQYIGRLEYTSLLIRSFESIKIEIGLRELLLDEIYQGIAQTVIKNPLIGNSAIKGIKLNCLSLKEAYAEKIRAALTRREPAISTLILIFLPNRQENF